jgi:tRNA-Thr(GGU) m(6)t(6)A37 methyltransferase TsaA
MTLQLKPIGILHAPFKEKFAVPRQAGLVMSMEAQLELFEEFSHGETLRGLDAFSHIWLIFAFHHNLERGWHPTVRPPRLGGNRRVGVFASRSPFRPNPLGLSAVALMRVDTRPKQAILHLRGADLVDGTPVYDIKPYLPYSDALPEAQGAFATQRPAQVAVCFSPAAEIDLQRHKERYPQLRQQIEDVLAQDPRPAYRTGRRDEHNYAVRIYDLELRWEVHGETLRVNRISPCLDDAG